MCLVAQPKNKVKKRKGMACGAGDEREVGDGELSDGIKLFRQAFG